MAIMSLRRRSRVKASMVLTRADHVFIHDNIYIYIYIYITSCVDQLSKASYTHTVYGIGQGFKPAVPLK